MVLDELGLLSNAGFEVASDIRRRYSHHCNSNPPRRSSQVHSKDFQLIGLRNNSRRAALDRSLLSNRAGEISDGLLPTVPETSKDESYWNCITLANDFCRISHVRPS